MNIAKESLSTPILETADISCNSINCSDSINTKSLSSDSLRYKGIELEIYIKEKINEALTNNKG